MLLSVMLMGLHAIASNKRVKTFVYVKALIQLLVYSPMSLTEQEPNVGFETETTSKGVNSTKHVYIQCMHNLKETTTPLQAIVPKNCQFYDCDEYFQLVNLSRYTMYTLAYIF